MTAYDGGLGSKGGGVIVATVGVQTDRPGNLLVGRKVAQRELLRAACNRARHGPSPLQHLLERYLAQRVTARPVSRAAAAGVGKERVRKGFPLKTWYRD